MMWMEETDGIRVNVARTEQAMAVKPSTIASACPYCLTMMSDGTKAKEVEDQSTRKTWRKYWPSLVFGPDGEQRKAVRSLRRTTLTFEEKDDETDSHRRRDANTMANSAVFKRCTCSRSRAHAISEA